MTVVAVQLKAKLERLDAGIKELEAYEPKSERARITKQNVIEVLRDQRRKILEQYWQVLEKEELVEIVRIENSATEGLKPGL